MATGGEIPFDEWLLQIGGITEDGKKKLEKCTVVSTTAVKFLTGEDIAEIRLGVGDRGIFKAAWQALIASEKTSDPPKEPEPEPSPSTVSRTYSIEEIARYFGSISQPPVVNPVNQGASGSTLQQPSVDGRAEALAAASGIRPTDPGITSRILSKDRLLSQLAAEYAQGGIQDTLSNHQLNLPVTYP